MQVASPVKVLSIFVFFKGMLAVSSCLATSPGLTICCTPGCQNSTFFFFFLFSLESLWISFPREGSFSAKRATGLEKKDACAPSSSPTTRAYSERPKRNSGTASWPCRSTKPWRKLCRVCGPGWRTFKTDWPVRRAPLEAKTPWKSGCYKYR